MEFGLAGKVALVAGASRRLGRAVAEARAAEGVNLVLSGSFSRPGTSQNLLSFSR